MWAESSPSIYDLTAGGVLAYFVIKEVLGFVLRLTAKNRKEDERTRTHTAGERSPDFWINTIDKIVCEHTAELKRETETNRLLLMQIREDQIRRGEREDARRERD